MHYVIMYVMTYALPNIYIKTYVYALPQYCKLSAYLYDGVCAHVLRQNAAAHYHNRYMRKNKICEKKNVAAHYHKRYMRIRVLR